MQQPIRGLVFDKDGTLFDFHATWSVWCDGLIRDLCGPDPAQVERLARRLDFDLDARRFAADQPDDRRHHGGDHRRGARGAAPRSRKARSAA